MHSTKIIIKKEFPLCTFSNLRYLWREMTSAQSKNGTFFKYRSHKTTVVFYINSLIWLSLQSQEILNRPVFVLEILKSVWKFWKLLKILKRFWTLLKILNRSWTYSENYWKFWTDSEHCWKFWTDSENSENCWKLWTDSEHCWKFWTDSEQILNIIENSEQILNNIFLLKSICFTSFSLDFN